MKPPPRAGLDTARAGPAEETGSVLIHGPLTLNMPSVPVTRRTTMVQLCPPEPNRCLVTHLRH
jgi:hypothetical protein